MPTMPSWQPQNPINAIIFDCDGTLCGIEGIDELANINHVGDEVIALTATAMGQTGITPELYRQRLDLVKPTNQQIIELGKLYQSQLVPDAKQVIQILQRLHKHIFVVSAGIYQSVQLLGASLDIPRENIFAVDISFHPDGSYADFDNNSPLTRCNGKLEIADNLKRQFGTLAHIGDGLNDFVVRDKVTRFIGYGGVYYRENIASNCEFYIKSKSLAAALPLLLTQAEADSLNQEDQALYQSGLTALAGET